MNLEMARQAHAAFAAAFTAGNLERLVAMYEPDAAVVPGPTAQAVTGHAAIRAALGQFLATKGKMHIETVYAHAAGGTALVRGKWTLSGTGPDGKPLAMGAESAEVYRRQPDGKWLMVVDCPFGAG